MKKFIFSFLLLSIAALNIYAQQGWFWLNPLPQGNYLSYVNFWGNNGLIIGNGGNLLKSTNLGNNWIIFNNSAYNIAYQAFVFDQNTYSIAVENNRLLKTTNGGNNWFSSSYISGEYPNLFFVNMQTGYAVYNNFYTYSYPFKLYKTTNGGVNWSLNLSDTSAVMRTIIFPDENTGYITGSKGIWSDSVLIYKTTNAGVVWYPINTGLNYEVRSSYFTNGNTGYLGCHNGIILKTTNGGINWQNMGSQGNSISKIHFINSNTGFINSQLNTKKTTNAGLNWVNIIIPEINFYYDGISNYVSVGGNGGISKSSNNGLNWINYSSSIHNGYCNDIETVNQNICFVACDGIILKSSNGGQNWSKYENHNMATYSSIFFLNELTGYAGGLFSTNGYTNIQKTTNSGENWFDVNAQNVINIYNIFFPTTQTGYAATKWGSFFKSTDSGLNWFQTGSFDLFDQGGLFFIDENTGYSAGHSYSSFGHIRKTTNGGINWTETNVDSIDMLNDIKFLNSFTGFTCGYYISQEMNNGAVGITTDQGITWSFQNLPVGKIFELSIADSNTVYACCENGKILKSTDVGQNWQVYQSCYSDYIVSLDFINQNTGYAVGYWGTIIKTTDGGGSPIGIEPISNIVPGEFRLFQNYPNPFNPVTKIKFSIPVSSQSDVVNIFIYDVTGREVRNYPLGNLKAGIYSIDFDGTELASGVYFCQLASGVYLQTKKMVLIK
ncbi:MAG: T9SS type A sorting domain-containing protein [Ignavibacteria bacterium]|nr:T9SS type A sorting domain-containing protein [Ignavibacteria bacterium]